MKTSVLFVVLTILCGIAFGQSDKAKLLLREGVELHDKGFFDKAILKYDEALGAEPGFADALYEKSFTLFKLNKHQACIDISKQLIKDFPSSPVLRAVYVQYGSALDVLGKPQEAIKVYNTGLKKFPDYFLLNFNKAMTYGTMNETKKAYECLQQALLANPFHSSSYFRTAELLRSTNKIPAMLAGIMHLVLEPQSDRSASSFKNLMLLMNGNVKRTGNNTTITLDASMLRGSKANKQPDNFSMQEMLFTMSSALDKDSAINSLAKTEIEKFDLRLQLLINSLSENGQGFFSERYVPLFKKILANNYSMMVSRLVFMNANDERNAVWFKVNTDKTEEFYNWLEAYEWAK